MDEGKRGRGRPSKGEAAKRKLNVKISPAQDAELNRRMLLTNKSKGFLVGEAIDKTTGDYK